MRKSVFLILIFAGLSVFAFDEVDNPVEMDETEEISAAKPPVEVSDTETPERSAPPYGGYDLEIRYNASTERMACEAYDLRDTLIGEGRPLPERRHQGNSGWCYAMVLSDLLSLHLGSAVSPADIAFANLNRTMPAHMNNFNNARDGGLAQAFPLGGGIATEVLSYLNNRGVCLEENFSINLSEPPVRAIASNGTKVDTPLPTLNTDSILRYFDPANRDSARRLLSSIQYSDFITALNGLSTNPRCEPQFTNLNARLNLDSHFTNGSPPPTYEQREPFWTRLNNSLRAGRIVAITYLPEMLTQNPREYLRDQAPMGNHLSSIVGRRYNAEKTRCEYLVRNTENDCSNYLDDYDCENNHVWVPRQILRLGISHFMTIQDN